MKIVFFGTPDYVLPILNGLHKAFVSGPGKSPIVAVVTQKPKPIGRKQILTYSPVDKWAHEHKIPAYYSFSELIENKVEADLGILESYGEILPKEAINMFQHGILNAHPSLLPKYRGASPSQAVILSGDKETGVTIIKLDEKIDHGTIISQFKEEVLETDTTETLRRRLFEKSKDVLVELIRPYLVGKIKTRKQDDSKASYTTRITKENGFILPEYLEDAIKGKTSKDKWEIPFIKNFFLSPSPSSLDRFIRAMDPWPYAWTNITINGNTKRLKLIKAHTEEGTLVLERVQLEGKNPVSYDEFGRGYPKATLA